MQLVEITIAMVKLASKLPEARMCQNSESASHVHHPDRSDLGKNNAPVDIPKIELMAACVPLILLNQRPEKVGTIAPAQTKSAIKNKYRTLSKAYPMSAAGIIRTAVTILATFSR